MKTLITKLTVAALIAGFASVSLWASGGKAVAADDARTPIYLSAPERAAVLGEMRSFLESLQAMTTGLAEGDMKAITASASMSGMKAAKAVPAPLMKKLPMEFRKLGMVTHNAFDEIASEAQELGDKKLLLTKIGDLMSNCTTCHASYRFELEGSK